MLSIFINAHGCDVLKVLIKKVVCTSVLEDADAFTGGILSFGSTLLQEIVDCLFSGCYFSADVDVHSTELQAVEFISYIMHRLFQ